MTKQTKNEKGFTIIEVVLVLAIAGLIFLIVFLALPQLQRSRRDTQRRNDVGRILAELENYASNNDGRYPDASNGGASDDFSGGSDSFAERYLQGVSFEDPSEGPYTFVYTGDPAVGEIHYETQVVCNGETFTGGGDRDVAVRTALEAGEVYYCSDNR